jgi:hypothetical protein
MESDNNVEPETLTDMEKRLRSIERSQELPSFEVVQLRKTVETNELLGLLTTALIWTGIIILSRRIVKLEGVGRASIS